MTVMQLPSDLANPAIPDIHPVKSKQQDAVPEETERQVENGQPAFEPENDKLTSTVKSVVEDVVNNVADPENDKLTSAVKSVVDDVVTNVAFTSSVEQEKIKVQKLITDLVTRVSNDASTTQTKPSQNDTPLASNAASETKDSVKTNSGVPYGDHRLRRIDSKPLTWMQTLDSITLNIHIPAWVRKQHVSIAFTPGSVKVRVARDSNVHVEIDEPLVARIDVDGCTWAVDDTGGRRQLTLELEKAREQWWARLFMNDDPDAYTVVDARGVEQETTISDLPCDENGEEIVEASGTETAYTDNGGGTVEDRHVASEGKGDRSITKEASLEDIVAETVEEVVEAVANEKEIDEINVADRDSRVAESSKQQRSQQKVLTREDLTTLIAQYKETFEKGGHSASSAALQLATFHHHGIGVEKDDAQAARFYKYALENGRPDPSAAFQLGLIYNSGAPGLEPSPEQAVHWWQVAAGLGNPIAMFNLGVMAMNGSGCDLDPVLATQWFSRAQALNPQLRPPQFSAAQLEQRFAMAAKLKRQRMKEMMSPEEKKRRREEALRKARIAGYTTIGIVGLMVSVAAVRHWMRNRL